MKRIFLKFLTVSIVVLFGFVMAACGQGEPAGVAARAVFEFDREIAPEGGPLMGTIFDARLTFVGEEAGGNVIIHINGVDVTASINPSREHPSFAGGEWHHHLYAGATAPGSPRINFMQAFPQLNIDDNDAADNTQSAYQRGNLHYIVETGEFRLTFTINGNRRELFFVEN